MKHNSKDIDPKVENHNDFQLNGKSTLQVSSKGSILNKNGSDKNLVEKKNKHINGDQHVQPNIIHQPEFLYKKKTIHQLFEEQVSRTPNRVAIIYENTELTYSELNVKANRLAHFLRENYAIKPDEPVGILTERSDRMIVAILAIIKAGGAYLPIEPSNPIERIKHMVEDSKMKVLLTEDPFYKKFHLEFSDLNVVDIWNEQYFSNVIENISSQNKPGDLVYIIYTSGSTGSPKGVMIEHSNLIHYVKSYLEKTGFSPDDVYLQVSSASFDAFSEEIYPALLTGAKVVITRKSQVWEIQELAEMINHYKATYITCTPALLSVLNEVLEPNGNLTFIAGGDVLKSKHISNLIDKSTIYNSYGPTETTVCATYYRVEKPVENPIPIGKALPGYQLYILDKNGKVALTGETGELCIAGKGLARGYLGNVELTNQKFINNPVNPGERIYKTGDLCRFLPDGNIEFAGRIDDQVKIRGFRIELGEIERTIIQFSDIKDCAVKVFENNGNKELSAYILPKTVSTNKKSGVSINIDALIDFLKTKLTDYMIPVYFVEMDQFPLNSNDKVDKQKLPTPTNRFNKEEREIITPATKTEKATAKIWESILNINRISTKDNFFDLGGHSLMAFRIVNKINEILEIRYPLSDFFANPTISEISKQIDYIKENQTSEKYNSLPIISRDNPLALSPGQQSLWFINEFSGDTAQYNIPMSLRMSGVLDSSKLSDSLNAIIKRRESLRTTFVNNEGDPYQVINNFKYQSLEIENISGLGEDEIELKLKEEARKTFDLNKPFLVRWKLLVISKTENILFICFHHIITDGWSINLFFKELEHFYNENSVPLPELTFHYPDYAFWINNLIASDSFKKHFDYWEKKLGFNPKSFELPTDKPREGLQTYNGNTLEANLSNELTEELKQFSHNNGKTLFMTLLSAFKVLLFKLTNQSTISIGSPSANRTLAETENMMGYFVNSLVLKTDLSGDLTFFELLKRIQQTTQEAYAHQEVPFEKLASHLLTTRDAKRSALFQILFVLENTTEDYPKLNGLEIENREIPTGNSIVDLSIIIEEINGQISVKAEYNTDLYFEETISQLLKQYKKTLNVLLANPDFPIAKLDIGIQPENHHGETYRNLSPFKSVVQRFEEQVEKAPDNVAIVFDNRQLTYLELNKMANQLAHNLRDNFGIKPEDPVGFITKRSDRMIVALLAIIKAGGAYVPIDPDNPIERIKYFIEDSKMKVLLSEDPIYASIQSELPDLNILDIWDQKNYSVRTENPVNIKKLNDLVYIIYTSGSTGTPKGVMIEHRNLVHYVDSYLDKFKLTSEDIYLQVTSASFDAFGEEIYPALLTGAKVVVTQKNQVWDIQKLIELINLYRASYISCTPALLSALNEVFIPERKITFLVGGDVLKREHINNLIKKSSIHNGYGPTEATICTTFYDLEVPVENPIPIGKALKGYQIYILNKDNKNAEVGESGELCIAGEGLARGYLGNEELTDKKFTFNPVNPGERIYHTGDLCRFLPNGNVDFIGRIDDQVKIRGFRIELGEIENRMLQYEGIKECVVVANKSAGYVVLIAYYITDTNKIKASSIDHGDIQEFLSKYLPDYMIPVYFVEMQQFPLNVNEKIDRSKLPEPAEYNVSDNFKISAEISEKEIAIVNIWEQVLNRKHITIDQNFFDLGGHSLLASKITYQVNKYFGTSILVSTIFEAQTIREFAQKVNNTESFNKTGAIIQLRPGQNDPIFLFSGNDGNPFTFNKLTNHYPNGQPLYFIQYPAGNEKVIPYKTLEEYITELIKKIKVIQPKGPYNIVGYSLGGSFAYETALQLKQAGDEVETLVILSAVPPLFASTKNPFINFILVEGDLFLKLNFSLKLKYLRYRVSHLFERFFRVLSHSPEKGVLNNVNLFVDITEDTEKYLGMYNLSIKYAITSKYKGDMLLVRETALDSDIIYTSYYFDKVYPDYHWNKFVEGKISIETVPFSHGVLLEEPYAKDIAEILYNYFIQSKENKK